MRTIHTVVVPAALAILIATTPAAAQRKGGGDSRRAFYLTQQTYFGSEASGACELGFHMASFWEVVDVTDLRYDTTRGFMRPDSGEGAPTGASGWIRTGLGASMSGLDAPGVANCSLWTEASPSFWGTSVLLNGLAYYGNAAPSGYVPAAGPWFTRTRTCDNRLPVWCVQD